MSTHLARVRQVSIKLLRLAWLGREMRRLGRGISRIPLGPFIVAAKTTGTVGSPIPLVQAISSIVVIALQSAQGVKRNHKQCKELANLARAVVSAVVDATSDMPEEELDEKTMVHLAELEWCVQEMLSNQPRPVVATGANCVRSGAGACSRSSTP
ncbi:uncharacterized protein TRAVEDRAFT_22824 [Trametes versicolor FP-101664 SS1]|uniref:uncharacterized protein n=1 Tax=Trametes versicolor (strain FP-101664) TaxID=717944 RepID=UPI00046235D6|nr:uncharacterized protein TRAVEDRAFT_22824 [Trametes versicolor FP-101664 SS1]EIW55019.1 hypothetical protein TRAVEDRAFT_22824 [Trametes versicolor FP-101664 SS1]